MHGEERTEKSFLNFKIGAMKNALELLCKQLKTITTILATMKLFYRENNMVSA